jgi:hypothetical protein
VDLDFKPGMGLGHHWDWEAADGTEVDALTVADCLGEVALVALMAAACWECTTGALAVHLLDSLAEQTWSASGL